jgi:hypothetical protein
MLPDLDPGQLVFVVEQTTELGAGDGGEAASGRIIRPALARTRFHGPPVNLTDYMRLTGISFSFLAVRLLTILCDCISGIAIIKVDQILRVFLFALAAAPSERMP